MIRTPFRSMLLGAAAAFGTLLAPALGALPAIFDRVPAEAVLVVTTKNLQDVDAGVSQLLASVELPALATPSELLRRAGLGEGIDMTRPLAIALMPGDMGADMPPAIALLPTTNFDAMMEAFNATAADGIYSIQIATGETLFVRQGAGGYAIVSPMRELAMAADGRVGNMKSHEADLGVVGAELAQASHVVAVVKKPLLDMLQQQIGPMMREQAGMAMMMGGGVDAQQMEEQLKKSQEFIESMLRDGRSFVFGMQAGATGLTIDTAMDFETESEFGAMFSASGNSASFMKRLPNQPFMLAFGADYTAPVVRKIVKAMAQMNQGMIPGFAEQMEKLNGQSAAMFVSPGGIMGGLLANTLMYSATADPKGMMEAIRESTAKVNEAVPMMKMTYQQDAAQVDGVSVDAWSMTMGMGAEADPFAGGMMGQMTTMLFGPGGMGGYYAPGKRGVYQTLSKNSLLVSAALKSEEGVDSIMENRGLSMVAERLPKNRTVEAYVGVHAILKQGLQLAAMFGAPFQVELPGQLPPVGMAMTTDRAAVRAVTFVPAPVIKTVGQVAMQAERMFGGRRGGDEGGAPPF